MDAIYQGAMTSLATHPWILLIFFLAYGIYKFMTIPKITDAVASHISMDPDTLKSLKDTVETIKEIRTDQLISNLERKEQGAKIEEIDQRVLAIEAEVKALKPLRCDKPECPNRV